MDEALASELLGMRDADQAAHDSVVGPDGRHLPDGHPAYAAWGECLRRHTQRLREIVATRGWPTISLVGRPAAQAAWLVAQHSDHDVAFQRAALELMTGLLPAGEADRGDVAYLTDRVLRADGRPQEYGTQLEERDGRLVPQPIREPRHLDARRAAVGLEPLSEYLERSAQLLGYRDQHG